MTNTETTVDAIYQAGILLGMDNDRLIVQMIRQQVFLRDYMETQDNPEELFHARNILAEITRRFSPFHEWNAVDSHIVCSGCGRSVESYNNPCK